MASADLAWSRELDPNLLRIGGRYSVDRNETMTVLLAEGIA
ncbi:hypothetical protein ACWEVP_01225 [Amycolatopsis sp. NPDC003865]